MLTQQRTPMNLDPSRALNLNLFQNSSPLKRKTIILQSPLDSLCFQQRPALTGSPVPINLFHFKDNSDFLYSSQRTEPTELTATRESESEKSELSLSSPARSTIHARSKRITKNTIAKEEKEKGKKIYEISRFFVKNYVGALKSTINNPHCEADILDFLGCTRDQIDEIKRELEKLLKENPKHNRMQLYKLIVNPVLNPIFQYFLRRKVVSWIFTSSKMQDKQAHLMARKNFLHLCVKAKELTPYNFKIALNFK